MLVIAFGHRQQVGKDTCAKYLSTILKTEHRKLNVRTIGFADELKDQCHRLYGWDGLKSKDHYELYPKEKEIILPTIQKSARQVWIDYGTKVAREIYHHTWVDFLFKLPTVNVLLIKDLRFENEFDRVEELGGLTVRVDNDRIAYTGDLADKQLYEKPDAAWKHLLKNHGSFADLHTNVHEFYEKEVKGRINV